MKAPTAMRRCSLCRKRLRYNSRTGTGAGLRFFFNCKPCGAQTTAEATPAERRAFAAHDRELDRQTSAIHRLYHAFERRFKTEDRKAWKWTGYEFMRRVDRLTGKKWDGMHVLACDDSYFASSSLLLIEHRDGAHYWGTTVVVIPQCDGQLPCEFFLYGSHLDPLVAALLKIQRRHRGSKRSER